MIFCGKTVKEKLRQVTMWWQCFLQINTQRIVDSKDLVLMMCVARSPAEEKVERRAERVEARGGVMG